MPIKLCRIPSAPHQLVVEPRGANTRAGSTAAEAKAARREAERQEASILRRKNYTLIAMEVSEWKLELASERDQAGM